MAKLIMTQGLPGSGKSYWAAQQTGAIVVNKDDIRRELAKSGWVWSHENEKDVITLRDSYIEQGLGEGKDVIVADTNFGRKHKVRLEGIARKFGAKFEIKRFDTPIELCIERDNARPDATRVGERVIRDMFNKFVLNDPRYPSSAKLVEIDVRPYVEPAEGDPCIICDLDGTLSLFEGKGHRGPYDAAKCDQDDCNETIRQVLEVYYRFMNYKIVYLSGREEIFRPQTETFLRKFHCPPGELFMRGKGDPRKDWIVKSELFDAHVRDRYKVKWVFDDRPQVLRMWQKMGLTTFAVGNLEEF